MMAQSTAQVHCINAITSVYWEPRREQFGKVQTPLTNLRPIASFDQTVPEKKPEALAT